MIKKTPIRNLTHHMNVTPMRLRTQYPKKSPWNNEYNDTYNPLFPQYHTALLNQNQTLNLVPPLVDSCISHGWDRWGICILTCTMPWCQFWVKVFTSILQFYLPHGTQIYVKICRIHRGVKTNPLKMRIQGGPKTRTSYIKHVPCNIFHLNALLSCTSPLHSTKPWIELSTSYIHYVPLECVPIRPKYPS